MLIQEVVAIKPQLPQTPAQARIAVLKKGVDRAQVAVKAEQQTAICGGNAAVISTIFPVLTQWPFI